MGKRLESRRADEVLGESTVDPSSPSLDKIVRAPRITKTFHFEAVDRIVPPSGDGPRPDQILQTEVAKDFFQRQHWQIVQIDFHSVGLD